MTTTFIYGLIDPIMQEVRYIGKANNPWERFYGKTGHLKRPDDTYKGHWIQSLLKQGLQPIYCILEQCDISIWKEREKDLITFGRQLHWPLTNIADGGDGGWPNVYKPMLGHHHSEATKKKIRDARLGTHHTEETKRKMRGNTNCKGFHHTEETKQKNRDAHIGKKWGHHTEETIIKIKEARKKQISPWKVHLEKMKNISNA